jgi:aarF domain-containing kinase
MIVLTMEFVYGVKVNDINGIKKLNCSVKDAARITLEVFAEMVYLYGFLHSDPHPGNILVRQNPKNKKQTQVILLDHGLYKELSEEFRIDYCKLWKAMILHEDENLKSYCDKLGVTDYKLYAAMILMRGYSNSQIGMGNHGTMEQWNKLKSDIFDNPEKLADIFNKMPKDMLLVFRTLSLLRGINQELGIPVNRYAINAKIAAQGIHYHHTTTQQQKKLDWTTWFNMRREAMKFKMVLFYYEWKQWCITVCYRIAIYMGWIQPFRVTIDKRDVDVVLAA